MYPWVTHTWNPLAGRCKHDCNYCYMKRSFLIIGVIFVITLAVVFGLRASADAMAVVIGVILGVAAGIPTTLLLVFVTWHLEQIPEGA